MSEEILRPRYFEGQKLSPDDLTTEQEYHVEARRRLNRLLFLPGIDEGLQIVVLDGAAYVAPGAAVDRLGRELSLDQAVALDADFLRDNPEPVSDGTSWYVFLRYSETPASRSEGRPGGQVTRIREGAEVVLSQTPPPASPSEGDAEQGVVLGQLRVDSRMAGTISNVNGDVRRFVGARLQRLQTPARPISNEAKDVTDLAEKQEPAFIEIVSPMQAQSSAVFAETLTVQGETLLAKKVAANMNVAVAGVTELGHSFPINLEEVEPALEDPKAKLTFGDDPGDLRVNKDAFFNGKVYVRVKKTDDKNEQEFRWRELQQLIDLRFTKIFDNTLLVKVKDEVKQQLPKLLPEAVTREDVLDLTAASPTKQSGDKTIDLPVTPASVDRVEIQIALCGVDLVTGVTPDLYKLSAATTSPAVNGTPNWQAKITWTATEQGGPKRSVDNFFYSYTAFCFPKTT